MTQRYRTPYPDAPKGPNRAPQWLGGPSEPLDAAEGMLRRAISKEVERRGLGNAGLMDVASAAGSTEWEADRHALRHWLAGDRHVRSDRLERALWALGITEDDLTELLQRRFKPIWCIQLRTSPPYDDRYVRAESEEEAVEVAVRELGISESQIRLVQPFDKRKRLRAGGTMEHRPPTGVFFVPEGTEPPEAIE